MPFLLIRTQLTGFWAPLRVFNLEQEVLAAIPNENVRATLTDGRQRLNGATELAQPVNNGALVAVYLGCSQFARP